MCCTLEGGEKTSVKNASDHKRASCERKYVNISSQTILPNGFPRQF